jgi:glycine betaine/proline transport system ATP-binding protein
MLRRDGGDTGQVLATPGCKVGLRDASLNIKAGEIFVIMGLSGSGKSTLVRHFNRLIEPSAGEILIDGRNVLAMSDAELRQLRRQTISMVFQGFGLMPHKTVLDNAAFGLLTRGDDKTQAHTVARNWLERVGLARALAADTDILLMDEAFSALDPLIRDDMQDQLLRLQSTLHKTIIFITHDLDEALKLGDHIAILRDGKLVQVGTPDEILRSPADDYVRKFVEKRGAAVAVLAPAPQPA